RTCSGAWPTTPWGAPLTGSTACVRLRSASPATARSRLACPSGSPNSNSGCRCNRRAAGEGRDRVAHHELRLEAPDDLPARLDPHGLQRDARRRLAHLYVRLTHGGERGAHVARQQDVVEAHDRDVVWHQPPGLSQGQQRAGGRLVVGGEGRRDVVAPTQQPLPAAVAPLLAEAAVDGEGFLVLDAGLA